MVLTSMLQAKEIAQALDREEVEVEVLNEGVMEQQNTSTRRSSIIYRIAKDS